MEKTQRKFDKDARKFKTVYVFSKQLPYYEPFFDACLSKFDNITFVGGETETSTFSSQHWISHDKLEASLHQGVIKKKIPSDGPIGAISFLYNKYIDRNLRDYFDRFLNFHASLLPNYRGAHCINWQIANGERQSGISVHELTNKIDCGDIVATRQFGVGSDATALDLLTDAVNESVKVIEAVDIFSCQANPQRALNIDDFACRPRTKQDSILQKGFSLDKMDRIIRASIPPWDGASYQDSLGNWIKITEVQTRAQLIEISKVINARN